MFTCTVIMCVRPKTFYPSVLPLLKSFLRRNAALVANINSDNISNREIAKRLGISIDYQLNYDKHVSLFCDKASQKLVFWFVFPLLFIKNRGNE